jgi:hypothetical protein
MPYQEVHVPAELILEFYGYKVFRAYKDDDANNPFTYQYCFEEDSDDIFDVRLLPNFGGSLKHPDKTDYHANVIREAISHGHLNKFLKQAGLYTIEEMEMHSDYRKLIQSDLVRAIEAYDRYCTRNLDEEIAVIPFELWYKNIYIGGTPNEISR